MNARAGIAIVCLGVTVAVAVAAKDLQGVTVACQRTCPDAVRFPAEASACVAEMALCQTRLGLYDTYMTQLAAGVTRTSGNINIPFNIAVVPSKQGIRVGLLAGFNSQ